MLLSLTPSPSPAGGILDPSLVCYFVGLRQGICSCPLAGYGGTERLIHRLYLQGCQIYFYIVQKILEESKISKSDMFTMVTRGCVQ